MFSKTLLPKQLILTQDTHLFLYILTVSAHFIEKYSLYSVMRGSPARLACEAYGSRPITIEWSRQDVKTGKISLLSIPIFAMTEFDASSSSSLTSPFGVSSSSLLDDTSVLTNRLPPSSPSVIDILSSPRFNAFQRDFAGPEDRTVFELHIQATDLNDTSAYSCKISNEYGGDTRNMDLTILG